MKSGTEVHAGRPGRLVRGKRHRDRSYAPHEQPRLRHVAVPSLFMCWRAKISSDIARSFLASFWIC